MRNRGFTIVELLVVVAIIALLFGAIFVATSSVLVRARVNSTLAVLQVASEALEEFKREQQANPTIAKASRSTVHGTYRYTDRYGFYPPDELEVFTPMGLPGWDVRANQNESRSLAPGGAVVASSEEIDLGGTGWNQMKFYQEGDNDNEEDEDNEYLLEHRDIAAMVTAIDLYGDASKAIIDKIPSRNWRGAPLAPGSEDPALWLDRPRRPGEQPDGRWGREDLEIRYLIDDWKTPLNYLAQRDWSTGEDPVITDARASSNHRVWRQVSSWFIRANGGRPIIMSYGPDGEDQLTKEAMTTLPSGEAEDAVASLVGDFSAYPDSTPDHKINHPMNEDNVYLNPDLRDKLATGQPDGQ